MSALAEREPRSQEHARRTLHDSSLQSFVPFSSAFVIGNGTRRFKNAFRSIVAANHRLGPELLLKGRARGTLQLQILSAIFRHCPGRDAGSTPKMTRCKCSQDGLYSALNRTRFFLSLLFLRTGPALIAIICVGRERLDLLGQPLTLTPLTQCLSAPLERAYPHAIVRP